MAFAVKAVVQLRALTGLAEDAVDNSFYFLYDGANDPPSGAELTALTTRLVNFYNATNAPSTDDLASQIGEQMTRASNGCAIYYYQSATISVPANWGTPIDVRSWTLSNAVAGNTLPSEVALVASYHADLTDVPETQTNPSPPPAVIRPASRLRGRLFIGPLMAGSGTEDATTHEFRPSSAYQLVLSRAMQALEAANDSTWNWAQASQTTGELTLVVGGYVDNSYDTQRRRGLAPTARTAWSA